MQSFVLNMLFLINISFFCLIFFFIVGHETIHPMVDIILSSVRIFVYLYVCPAQITHLDCDTMWN